MASSLTQIREQCPKDQLFSIEDAKDQTPGYVWIKQPVLEGKGADASVYQVCRETNTGETSCYYVVKQIKKKDRTSLESFKKQFENEVKMHTTLQSSGIAPKVYDAFICGEEGYIVLDKKDYNIRNYAFKLLEELKSSKQVKSILEEIHTSLIRLLNVLHSYLYIHDDPHLENFMINVRGGDLTHWINPQIIDFGKARKVNSIEEANRLEGPSEIKMSFEKLYSDLEEKEKSNQSNDPENIARQKIMSKAVPEAPRKGKATSLTNAPSKKQASREIISSDSYASPLKKSRPTILSFDDTPKTPVQLQYDTPRTPTPMSSDSFQTPIKGQGLFPSTPVSEDTFLSKNLMKSFEDDNDNEDDSFVIRRHFSDSDDEDAIQERYYPYRFGQEDRSVDMIDPDYYIDKDYGSDDEYLQEYEGDF
jgi:tRNA A-37 threonylcarbamoyl transferase component Bud32